MGQAENDAKKQTRREVIINSLKQLVLQAGIESITIDLIKERIKEIDSENSMGKGTIYSVFANKEDIFVGTVKAIEEKFLHDLQTHAANELPHEELIQHYIDTCFSNIDDYLIYQEVTRHILRTNRLTKKTVDVTAITPPSQLEEQSGIRDILVIALTQWLNQLRKRARVNIAPPLKAEHELDLQVQNTALDTKSDDARIIHRALLILGGLTDVCALRQEHMEPDPIFIMNIVESYLKEYI